MDEVTQLNRAVFRVAIMAGVGALLLVATMVGARAVLASGPAPQITCDQELVEYGQTVHCEATGAGVAGLAWPDGTVGAHGQPVGHAPQAVGDVSVHAVDGDGSVLASVALVIAPDVDLECDVGDEKIVYRIEATDLRSEGIRMADPRPASNESSSSERTAPASVRSIARQPTTWAATIR